MADLCLPLNAGEDTFKVHLVQLELEPGEKQIRNLEVRQGQLRERRAVLKTSQTDAHKFRVIIQCAANSPSTSSMSVSLQGPGKPGPSDDFSSGL